MSPNALIYFVKYPEPGKVKTRLAKTIGNEAAARAYQSLAEGNFLVAKSLNSAAVQTNVVFDPEEKEKEIRNWLPGAADYWPQNGVDLGERLALAFQQAFDEGAKSAIALGSDTLGLSPQILHRALDALNYYDAVLGPAKDGGYYLIGLSSPRPSLFTDIPWSTGDVLRITLAQIRENKLTYRLLGELEDLDEVKISNEKRCCYETRKQRKRKTSGKWSVSAPYGSR